jgi:hypothetical protein
MASCSFSEEMFLKTQTFMGVSYLPPGSPTAIIPERVIKDLSQCAREVPMFQALSPLFISMCPFFCAGIKGNLQCRKISFFMVTASFLVQVKNPQ